MKWTFLLTPLLLALAACSTHSTTPERPNGNMATEQARSLAQSGPGGVMPSPTP